MRLINGKRFEPGPFNLGRFGPYLGSLAVLWVIFITVCTPSLRIIHCLCMFKCMQPHVRLRTGSSSVFHGILYMARLVHFSQQSMSFGKAVTLA